MPATVDPQVLATAYIARLRAALLAGDRAGFARLLSYPVRVNTASRCVAVMTSPDMFIEYFDQVVTGRVDQALRGFQPPVGVHWQGISLGRGSVWVSAETGVATVLSFNSDAWRFALPCAGEPEQAMPLNLSGIWQVTSVAILQGGQLVPRSPRRWLGRRVELDLPNKSARLMLDAEATEKCVVERSARWDPDNIGALGAPRAGLSPSNGPFIDLACGSGSQRRVERVDILGESTLAIVGDDKYLLILKRAPARVLAVRVLKPHAPCGASDEVCPNQQICLARSDPSYALQESCTPID